MTINRSGIDTPKPQTRSRPPRKKKTRFFSFRRTLLVIVLLLIAVTIGAAKIPTSRQIYGNGYLMSYREAKLRSSVKGIVDKCLVTSGSPVEKGQLLIQLNDSRSQLALEQAKSRLKVEQTRLDYLLSQQALERSERQEQVRQAELSHRLATKYLDRMITAGAHRDLMSDHEIDEAQLRADLAASRLSELQLSREEVMNKEIVVAQLKIADRGKQLMLLEEERKLHQIRSPLPGIVRFHRFETGEVVKPEDVLGQVFDCDVWVVRLKLSERFITYVEVGQPVAVGLTAYSTLRHGYSDAEVSRVEKVVTPRATGDGVFYVEARLEQNDGWEFQPGMSAWGYIDVGRTNWLSRLLDW